MQALTTTIVKAEREEPTSPALAQLKDEVRVQLEQLLALHAQMSADLSADGRKHQGWFDQTVARARALLDASIGTA